MNVISTEIPDILIIEPKVHCDERGFFFESYNMKSFREVTGLERDFVQDNHSYSTQSVLRGLHYQIKRPQGKLVRVVSGSVLDVAVDIRRSSEFFGKWVSVELTAENKRQLWIPEGFAHGFLVLSESAEFLYKTTDYYSPQFERCIRWNDADLAINWQCREDPLVSRNDRQGSAFDEADVFE